MAYFVMGLIDLILTALLPLSAVVAGGLLTREHGKGRDLRYWAGIVLMLAGPVAFLWVDRTVLLMPSYPSPVDWWSVLFLTALIALVAVLGIPPLRSRRWLVWTAGGGVLILTAAPVVTLLAIVFFFSN